MGAQVIAGIVVDSRCLAAGYPTAHIDFKFNAYCTRRVDQTDVTVPLAKAEGRP